VVSASVLRLDGREFDPRLSHCRSVGSGMGDRSSGWHVPSWYASTAVTRPKCGDALRMGSKGRMAHSIRG